MKYKIKYYEIQSDHILAVPQFSSEEIIEADSLASVDKYIRKKGYFKAKPATKENFDFDYTNSWGAVKIKRYLPPKVKRI